VEDSDDCGVNVLMAALVKWATEQIFAAFCVFLSACHHKHTRL